MKESLPVETWDAIRARRNVRSYQSEPVSEEDLDRIAEAAWRAPSASNRQHWDFVIVTDKDKLQALSKVWRGAGHIAGAAAAIALIDSVNPYPDFLYTIFIRFPRRLRRARTAGRRRSSRRRPWPRVDEVVAVAVTSEHGSSPGYSGGQNNCLNCSMIHFMEPIVLLHCGKACWNVL